MVRKKVKIPNVVRGGIAIPLGKDNMYLMKGKKHSQGGIDIGNNPHTGMEVEDGEVMQMTNNGAKVFSTMPFLNGQSPANKVLQGQNPNEVFKHQENFKKRNNINNDGTYGRSENVGFGNANAQEIFADGGFKDNLIQEKDNTRIGNINTNERQRMIPYGAGNIDRSPLTILDAIENYGKSDNPYLITGIAPTPSFANKYTMINTANNIKRAMTLNDIKRGIRPISSLSKSNVYRVTNMREIKDAKNVGILRRMPPSDDIKPVKIGRFIIGGPGVRDHGGKAAVAGKPWGAAVHGNAGEKTYIMSIPGRKTRWRTGHNGRYSKSYKKFNEIKTGTPLFNKFDNNGNTPIKTDKLKVYEIIQPNIVKLKRPWEYKTGGYHSSNNIRRRISNMEGSSMRTNRAFDLEDRDFWNAMPNDVRRNLNQEALDNLYSYSYNVGAGAFKNRVVPALIKLNNGTGSVKEVQDSMWASKDKQLRGLRIRRNIERQGFADAYNARQNRINTILDNTNNMINNINEDNNKVKTADVDNTYVKKPMLVNPIINKKVTKFKVNDNSIKLGMNMLNDRVRYNSVFAMGGRKVPSTGDYSRTNFVQKRDATRADNRNYNERNRRTYNIQNIEDSRLRNARKRARELSVKGSLGKITAAERNEYNNILKQYPNILTNTGVAPTPGRGKTTLKGLRNIRNAKNVVSKPAISKPTGGGVFVTGSKPASVAKPAGVAASKKSYVAPKSSVLSHNIYTRPFANTSTIKTKTLSANEIRNKFNASKRKPYITPSVKESNLDYKEQAKNILFGQNRFNTSNSPTMQRIQQQSFNNAKAEYVNQKVTEQLRNRPNRRPHRIADTVVKRRNSIFSKLTTALASSVALDYSNNKYQQAVGSEKNNSKRNTSNDIQKSIENISITKNHRYKANDGRTFNTHAQALQHNKDIYNSNNLTHSAAASQRQQTPAAASQRQQTPAAASQRQQTPAADRTNKSTKTNRSSKSTKKLSPYEKTKANILISANNYFANNAKEVFNPNNKEDIKHPTNISRLAPMQTVFDIKDTAKSLSDRATNDIQRRATLNYNNRKNNTADKIALASNALGSIISAGINDRMLDSLKYPSAPVTMRAAKLKTNYNINPQIDALNENLYNTYQDINNSTGSSQLALARRQRFAFNNALATNSLYGNKENQQTQLINQDRANQQQVANQNIQNYNAWNQAKTNFDNDIAEKRSENYVGMLQNVNFGIQDILARREQRRHDDNTIKAMLAANPNVTANYFKHYGLDLYRFGGRRFNKH